MKKYRLTPTRSQLLRILRSSRVPVSADELRRQLSVNKTTVYRQLESLVAQGKITQIDLADRTSRYESAETAHHHHLVCLSCRRICDISFPENIATTVKSIADSRKFNIKFHRLEFFGLCADCRS
jgi:Fe2+ or Zn2+ uptake regulation protein